MSDTRVSEERLAEVEAELSDSLLAEQDGATYSFFFEMRSMARELIDLRGVVREMTEALDKVRVFVADEQACRECSYLPEPTAQEEPYLQAAQDTMNTINNALARAKGDKGGKSGQVA